MSAFIALYKGPGHWTNALIRRWQRSPYSHCEVVLRRLQSVDRIEAPHQFDCWSASAMDGGVRLKTMPLDPAHWELYELKHFSGLTADAWFRANTGKGYDLLGLLGFVWRPWRGDRGRYWCSEACAAALGIDEPFRFDVATFATLVRRLGKQVQL
jgi:hypothetical protein